MKAKTLNIKYNVLRLLLFTCLFLFYSCDTDSDEINIEKDSIEEQLIDDEALVNTKSNPYWGNAWAIYNDLPADPNLQFHPNDEYITIDRESTGSYKITFPGLGYLYPGVVHVSSILGTGLAQVEYWRRNGNDLEAFVLTFDGDNGSLTNNQPFTIFLYKRNENNNSNAAYNWGNSPFFNYNSKGLRNEIIKIETGKYRVKFPGMQSRDGNKGHFQITMYGAPPRYYEIESVTQNNSNGVEAIVRIYDTNGNPANSHFVASYTSKFLLNDFRPGGYFYYNGTSAPSNLKTDFPFNREVTVEKSGSGAATRYLVRIPNSYAFLADIRPMLMVTSYGNGKVSAYVSHFVQLNRELWMVVNFKSLDESTLPTNPKFNLFYMLGGF